MVLSSQVWRGPWGLEGVRETAPEGAEGPLVNKAVARKAHWV